MTTINNDLTLTELAARWMRHNRENGFYKRNQALLLNDCAKYLNAQRHCGRAHAWAVSHSALAEMGHSGAAFIDISASTSFSVIVKQNKETIAFSLSELLEIANKQLAA